MLNMEIKLHNSLTDKTEVFEPIKKGEVSIYVCGPTVYDHIHIGNTRPVICFDTLRRFLSYVGYKVEFVSNYTDVDDKIINRAKELGISEKDLSDTYIKEFNEITDSLNALRPNVTPRVTEYMPQIISYIDDLVKNGSAYYIDGDVYFRVTKIRDYGVLSKINVEDLISGARVEKNEKKESPIDFTLWKDTNVGIKWNSPWGEGRPGWHTECCVMINSIFGGLIDIHGGGFDLKFPHHENEIAQAEAHNGNKIAHYWMHNGFINLDGEKMSKSLGNVIHAKDFINKYSGNVVRFLTISTHYRAPINITDETIENAINGYSKIESTYVKLASFLQLNDIDLNRGLPRFMDNFLIALADDLNTSNAIMEIYNLLKLINNAMRNRDKDLALLNDYFASLNDMISIIGLHIVYHLLTNEDKKLYNKYLEAKANKDFALSDELRNELIAKQII